ncbi:MAG: hypothetical protein NVS2B3_06960 [Vulcanimicrobiaceae bacterium]
MNAEANALNERSNWAASAPRTRPAAGRSPFLPYLEGLRGITALYVVFFHVVHQLERDYAPFGPTARLLPFRGQFFLYGHYAVSIFIVISGFVLSLPVVLRGDLVGGWRAFCKRRARRLLPAYYAALCLAVPLYLLEVHQNNAHTTMTNVLVQLVTHALLIQDVSPRTFEGIDGPMWSVAIEVQIYVVFVVLLLPVLRRFGLLATIVAGFAVGCAPTVVGALRHQSVYALQYACFWYLGLFALGLAAATVAYSGDDRYVRLKRRIPWTLISIVATATFVFLVSPLYDDRYSSSSFLTLDVILGAAVASGFVAIARDQALGKRSIVATVLGWRGFVFLGTFSYSLYLINDPIILVVMKAIYGDPPAVKAFVGFGVLVPSIVVAAYLFAKVFELPFVSTGHRSVGPTRVPSADRRSRGRADRGRAYTP